MRLMSMERTVAKKNICRKKSERSPTKAKRANSYGGESVGHKRFMGRGRGLSHLDGRYHADEAKSQHRQLHAHVLEDVPPFLA